MNKNQRMAILAVASMGLVILPVRTALKHGVFQSLSLGDYFMLPYIMLLGVIFSVVAVLKSTFGDIRISALSLLMYLTCNTALSAIEPQYFNAESLGWATAVCGFLTAAAGFTALAAFNKIDNKR